MSISPAQFLAESMRDRELHNAARTVAYCVEDIVRKGVAAGCSAPEITERLEQALQAETDKVANPSTEYTAHLAAMRDQINTWKTTVR